ESRQPIGTASALCRCIEVCKHGLLVKPSTGDVRLIPWPDIELAGALGCSDVDPGTRKQLHPFFAVAPVNDVDELVSGFHSFGHERQENCVLFLFTAEERAYMTRACLRRSGQTNSLWPSFHRSLR